jgi:hypothetical protein
LISYWTISNVFILLSGNHWKSKMPAIKLDKKCMKTSVRVLLSIISMAIIVGFFCTSNQNVFALTDTERYNTGYNHGCSDAKLGGRPYLNSHPSHTPIFMNGYQQGYAACSSSHTPSPSTTITVNRNNIFSDQNLCKAVQTWLTLSCSSYVNSNGVLTSEGERAKGCITNGALLTGAGYYFAPGALALLGPKGVINILKPLAESSGCGGIVEWQKLSQDTDSATALLNLLGIH